MRPAKYTLGVFFLLALVVVPMSAWAQQSPPATGSEAQLIAVLKSDAPIYDKAKACQQLAVTGTKEAVPVLAGLLADEKLAHYARFGLQPIPDPSVDEAFRDALGKLKGGLLVGVINSIGMRRDVKALDKLAELMGNSDKEVAAAAANALGRIHTQEAIEKLRDAYESNDALRPAICEAGLTAADMLLAEGKQDAAVTIYDAIREADVAKRFTIAALEGGILARGAEGREMMVECLNAKDPAEYAVGLAVAQKLPGAEITKALVEQLKKAVPAGEPAKEAAKELVILKAEYGAQDKWADVTAKVAAAVQGGKLAITAGNELAGDPISGVVKQLRVSYRVGDKEAQATAAENSVLSIGSGEVACVPQALLVYALGARGDKTALPVVLQMAKTGPAAVRLAATRVLARLGDASVVPVLLETAGSAQGDLAQAARAALAELPGKEVDDALTAALGQSKGQQLAAVIELIGLRSISSAVPALQKLAESDDPQVRAAATAALGLTVGLGELPALIDGLVQAKSPEAAASAREVLRKACLRMPDREACAAKLIEAMAKASPAAQASLLELLGVVGGQRALKTVSTVATTSSGELQDAAARVLGAWMSPDAAPVLLEMSKSGAYKVRALRGYIRIIRQLNLPAEQKLSMCRTAMELAGRTEEKKLVLEVLPRLSSPEALAQAMAQLSDPALKDTAATVAVKISQKIAKQQPAVVAEALAKVIEAAPKADVVAAAKLLLDQVKK